MVKYMTYAYFTSFSNYDKIGFLAGYIFYCYNYSSDDDQSESYTLYMNFPISYKVKPAFAICFKNNCAILKFLKHIYLNPNFSLKV